MGISCETNEESRSRLCSMETRSHKRYARGYGRGLVTCGPDCLLVGARTVGVRADVGAQALRESVGFIVDEAVAGQVKPGARGASVDDGFPPIRQGSAPARACASSLPLPGAECFPPVADGEHSVGDRRRRSPASCRRKRDSGSGHGRDHRPRLPSRRPGRRSPPLSSVLRPPIAAA